MEKPRVSPDGASLPGRRIALALIAALAIGRLLIAGLTPLAPDEAYYALWARSLSAGYFDHPPLIAFFIRAGTLLFGETPLGVRFACALAALPASFFVWRAAAILLGDEDRAPLAALFFNVTLIGYFGMTVATPDAPLVLFSAAMVYCAARLTVRDRLGDWLLMGAATGLAFEAKYSAALLAAGFSIAVLIIPAWRRQLLTPKPWLALVALFAVFAPNILWNASHGWATFLKQGGRVAREAPFAPRFLAELIGAQIGLATPLIFALGVLGLLPLAAGAYRSAAARRLLLALILVPSAYFAFHALRARVEGNWPGFLYPALAITAAAAFAPNAGRVLAFVSRAALPLALAIAVIGSVYVVVGPTTAFGRKEPILRTTRGWNALAASVRAKADAIGARYVLTFDYQLNAELSMLLTGIPVAQGNEPERYSMLAEPRPENLTGTGLVVSRGDIGSQLKKVFPTVEPLGTAEQRYGDVVVERFSLYRIEPSAAP